MDTIGEQMKAVVLMSGKFGFRQQRRHPMEPRCISNRWEKLSSAAFPKHDDYGYHSTFGRHFAIRLEALTSEALGFRGPGRKANFNLTSFEVEPKIGDGDLHR